MTGLDEDIEVGEETFEVAKAVGKQFYPQRAHSASTQCNARDSSNKNIPG